MTLEEMVEIAYPQQPHCPTILLLDTSGSMNISGKIDDLNSGIKTFKEEIEKDDLARKRIDLAVVAFGQSVQVVSGFKSIEEFEPEVLVADGLTPMGSAIKKAVEMLEARKDEYKKEGIDYYRPWIFMITDGEPTDMKEGDELWSETLNAVHSGEKEGKFLFFTVGVDEADMETLKMIAPPNRPPIKLKENHFNEMFIWLSRSQAKVSASKVGEQVVLEDPFDMLSGWGEIPTI